MNTPGFFRFYNYGGAPGRGGTSRLGCGYRGVFAAPEGSQVRVLDWSDGCVAKIKRADFEARATPEAPRKAIVRACLKRAPRTPLRRLCKNFMKES